MRARTKRMLTYLSGILTGIILTLAVLLCITKCRNDKAAREQENATALEELEQSSENVEEIDDPYYEDRKYEDMTLYGRPRKQFQAASLKVYQVLPSGNARAVLTDPKGLSKRVMLLGGDENCYYDLQEIELSEKKVRIIGTCRYGKATFPVVGVFDK